MAIFKSAVTGRFVTRARALARPSRNYLLGRSDLIGRGQRRDLERALHEFTEQLGIHAALTTSQSLEVAISDFADHWVDARR